MARLHAQEEQDFTDITDAMNAIGVDTGAPPGLVGDDANDAPASQICVSGISAARRDACVLAIGALHTAAPWRQLDPPHIVEAFIAGKRYYLGCMGGGGHCEPTLAIYATFDDAESVIDAGPMNLQHPMYRIQFGQLAQPQPAADRAICTHLLGRRAFNRGSAYPAAWRSSNVAGCPRRA